MNRWRSARSGWWLGALLAALLWLPLVGALHQIVHGGSPLKGLEVANAVKVPSTSSGRTEGRASGRMDARESGGTEERESGGTEECESGGTEECASGQTEGVESARAEGVDHPSRPVRAELVEAGDVRGATLVKAFAGLFSTHGSEADCRVFDQLSHGPLLIGVVAATLPALSVATCPCCRLPAPPDLASAVPTARGPPGLA